MKISIFGFSLPSFSSRSYRFSEFWRPLSSGSVISVIAEIPYSAFCRRRSSGTAICIIAEIPTIHENTMFVIIGPLENLPISS